MKRILWLVLLALLLCGCTEPEQSETTIPVETTQAPTEPTEPAGIYVPNSDAEVQSGGAVRYFLPETEECYGIRMMGSDLLTFSGTETTTLTRYAGKQLYALASAELDCWIDPEETSFQISSNGITYYNPETREVVFLDNDLKEVRRLGMPEDMVGKPVLSSNRMLVYYCTADAVRIYDTATGLVKLLKTVSYPQQSVEDVLLNDSVLRCTFVDERGQKYVVFLSAETGGLLSQVEMTGMEVTTEADRYYAKVWEGIQPLLVFGREGEDARVLTPADPFAESWYLERANSLLTATVTEEYTRLDCYDLSTGLHSAEVELPAGLYPKFAEVQPDTGDVLIMVYDYLRDCPAILSWQPDATPAEDEMVYAGPRYTAGDPDVLGLDACAILAREIGEKHGLNILLAKDAVAHQPWDYVLEMEYQVSVIQEQLKTLDAVFSHFPEGFFEDLYGQTSICIVRAIRGSAESGSLENAQGVQFWDGNQPYVALAAGDTLESAFYHEIFHVMDSKILSQTRVYYYWHNLNPEGCVYFEDYTSYLEADVAQYLQEEDRVFIDAYSMCYPKEDRARIMEYACMEDNAHYFQSEVMQSKLKLLCEGIRAAFGLKHYPQPLLWEQYLAEPLAPAA